MSMVENNFTKTKADLMIDRYGLKAVSKISLTERGMAHRKTHSVSKTNLAANHDLMHLNYPEIADRYTSLSRQL